MAEIVDDFPASCRWKSAPKYPWHELLDGQIRKLATDDYDCATKSFATQCRIAAKKLGLKVKIRSLEDCIYLQAIKKSESNGHSSD